MRIVIDLDGTICELRKGAETYADVLPRAGAAKKLEALKAAGHRIIIHTARHMKTCEGDVEKVIEKIGKPTEAWLAKHKIPYDELLFGKPYGDLYIDDLAHAFTSWKDKTLGKKISKHKTLPRKKR